MGGIANLTFWGFGSTDGPIPHRPLPPSSILDKQGRRSYITDKTMSTGGITRRLAYEVWIKGCPCKE
jgi:hypothetical protein